MTFVSRFSRKRIPSVGFYSVRCPKGGVVNQVSTFIVQLKFNCLVSILFNHKIRDLTTPHTPRQLGINRRYRAILLRYSAGLSPLAQVNWSWLTKVNYRRTGRGRKRFLSRPLIPSITGGNTQ